MTRRTFPSQAFPKATVFRAGPFTGVMDSDAPATSRNDRCKSIVNAYRQVGRGTVRIVGRPGFTVAGTTLGASVQYVGQFSLTNGTEYTVAIAGGEIYTYSWGGDIWTKQVSTANLTTAGAALSSAAKIRCVVFFGTLVINDGVNIPITWNGTAGAGGLVELNNAAVAYGQPVVYYSKLFFIKNAERDTIIWSEEGDAATGYEAGGYNNAWSLPGSKGEKIVALAARNDSLGVVRPRSTTTITGAVNDAFATTGTRASVSETIGSNSPEGAIVLDDGTVVLDADGLPQYWPSGSGYSQSPAMSDDCILTLQAVPRTALAAAQWVYDPETGLVILAIGDVSSDNLTQYLCFEWTGGTPNYVGRWEGFDSTALGMVKDADNVPRLMHGGSTGLTYAHGIPTGTDWDDNGAAIDHQIVGPALGYDTDTEARFDEITWVGFSPTGMTACVADYETPYGVPAAAQTVAFSASGFVLGVSILGTDRLLSGSGERRKRIGTLAFGRWCRPRLSHSTLNEQFGIELLTVTAAAEGAPPGAA